MPTVLKGNFGNFRSFNEEGLLLSLLDEMEKGEDRFTTKRYQSDIDYYLMLKHLNALGMNYFFGGYGIALLFLIMDSWLTGYVGFPEFIVTLGGISLLILSWQVSFPSLKYEEQIIEYLNYKRGKEGDRKMPPGAHENNKRAA